MRTYIKSKETTNKIMIRVLIALTPIILFGIYKNGIMVFTKTNDIFDLLKPILLLLIPVLTSFLLEYLYYLFIVKKENVIKATLDSYAFFPGLFLGLIMPLNTPISMMIIGSICATVIGKLFYGGFGRNIFNPALVGRLFIIGSYGAVISKLGSVHTAIDTISKATPLTSLALEKTITSNFEYTISNLFFGFYPGTLGETSALLCLVALLYLMFTKTIKAKISLSYIISVFLIALTIGLINGSGLEYALVHVLSGGLLFGAVFMATDPVTSPIAMQGQILYGISLGIITMFCRLLTPYPEGVLTSILFMNMLAKPIDTLGINLNNHLKRVLVLLVIIALSALIINATTSVKKEVNFVVENIKEKGQEVIYTASNLEGFAGKIIAQITFNNDKITEVKVLEHNETYYKQIEDNKYLSKFNGNISNAQNVDTVSGATVTSTAIKNIVTQTILEYEKKYKVSVREEQEEITPVVVTPKEDFKVISTTVPKRNYTKYRVSKLGFMSEIIADVTLYKGQFNKIEIIEHNESEYYYSLIEESDFIKKLNSPGVDYKDVDTISGATNTSQAILDLISKTEKLAEEEDE